MDPAEPAVAEPVVIDNDPERPAEALPDCREMAPDVFEDEPEVRANTPEVYNYDRHQSSDRAMVSGKYAGPIWSFQTKRGRYRRSQMPSPR